MHSHVTAGQVALPKGFTLITPPETVVVAVEITPRRAPAKRRRPTRNRRSPTQHRRRPQRRHRRSASLMRGRNRRSIVGLGNPGPRYARTRHNIGFIVVDALAERWGVRDWHKKGEARYAVDRARNAILVEPQSYMNLSGARARASRRSTKYRRERILVVVDDLDLPFGTLRMRASGSSGGHNGLKSLIEVFGQGFPRLRVGIGRGHDPDAIERVLGDFSRDGVEGTPCDRRPRGSGVEIG